MNHTQQRLKQAVLLFAAFFAVIISQAQTNTWKIILHKKTFLFASTENVEKNTRKLKMSDWKKSGSLEIEYTDSDSTTWYRSFIFTDKNDNELFRTDSSFTAKIPLTQLRQLYRGKKEIVILTAVTPRDPNLAVRVRRVHLCTLQIK